MVVIVSLELTPLWVLLLCYNLYLLMLQVL